MSHQNFTCFCWTKVKIYAIEVSHPTKQFVSLQVCSHAPTVKFMGLGHSGTHLGPSLHSHTIFRALWNKANLRDLIAATGLVILLKFDPNHRFFSPCDLEISWMTSENNRAPLLYYIKLCASFQIHRWIETEVIVQKHSIRVKIGDFLSCVTLKFDGWPWKTIGHFFYTTPSFVHHFKSIGEFKLELQSGNAQFGSKSAIFFPA